MESKFHVKSPTMGRQAQKDRTRRDLLTSARLLIDGGGVPTVSDAADHAQVSRTTAYRYFSSQDALLAQAGIEPLIAQLEKAIEATLTIADPVVRVDAAFARVVPLLLVREAQLRMMLKIALDRSQNEDFVNFSLLQSLPGVTVWDTLLQ